MASGFFLAQAATEVASTSAATSAPATTASVTEPASNERPPVAPRYIASGPAETQATSQVQAAPSFWDVSKWDGTTWATVSLVTIVGLMIIIWGVVRFWLVSTRPPKLKDVHTPTLDRMNTSALEHMGDETPPEEEIVPPADLLAAVPEEETPKEGEKKDGEEKKPE